MPDRRRVLAGLGALGAGAGLGLGAGDAAGAPGSILTRAIPASGERVPAIGMGTWITFNVGASERLRAQRRAVLETFFARGGGMIDSSPMYGSAEAVLGHGLARLENAQGLFSATKVWTLGQDRGIAQMEASLKLWGLERFDLMQVHNLLDWQAHLETLTAWKAAGRVRYVGITTSHGRRHGDLADLMASRPLDMVQFTYNVLDREAERRLLPLAEDKGLAVIVNRPFRRGALFEHVAGHALPAWAREFGCANWAQFFLKFIVSHPAVTCAIPATSRVDHMIENMGALSGPLPDARTRARMIAHVEAL